MKDRTARWIYLTALWAAGLPLLVTGALMAVVLWPILLGLLLFVLWKGFTNSRLNKKEAAWLEDMARDLQDSERSP